MREKSLLALISASVIGAGCVSAIPEPVSLPTLACEDAYRINSRGNTFYACYTDVFTDPVDDEHARSVYETAGLIGKVKRYEQSVLGFEETMNHREYRRGDIEELTEEGSVPYMLYIIPELKISVEPRHKEHIPAPTDWREDVAETTMLYSLSDSLENEEEYYRTQGFDVYRRIIVNFSSASNTRLGCSITDSFMERPIARRIKTPIHEDWHYNRRQVWGHRYIPRIDESLAELVGLAGAVDFAARESGIGSEVYEKTVQALEKWRSRAEFTVRYYEELSTLYAMNIPEEEKAIKRQEILGRASQEWKEITGKDAEINNATLMVDLPYTWLFLRAYRVYEAHPDMGELVMILKNTPDNEREAIEYLERFSASEI